MPSTPRLFAAIPAAGRSRRMGQPKLLLPVGGRAVIDRLLDALEHPRIAARVVVLRRTDSELARALDGRDAVRVQPDVDPPDMRTSVEHALGEIRERFEPDDEEGWLLVPADHPTLNADVLESLINEWDETSAPIMIPRHDGRGGHPAFFRWRLAAEVPRIPADRGLNELVARHAGEVHEFATEDPSVTTDLDTPEDYERVRDASD